MLAQEQVVQLMKYDTKLILPTLEPIVKQQATEQGINILEINVLLKNRAEKITDLTEKSLHLRTTTLRLCKPPTTLYSIFWCMYNNPC